LKFLPETQAQSPTVDDSYDHVMMSHIYTPRNLADGLYEARIICYHVITMLAAHSVSIYI
jgi:hypothetical protein